MPSFADRKHTIVYAQQQAQPVPAAFRAAVWTSFGQAEIRSAQPDNPSDRQLIDTVIDICERKQIWPVPPIYIAHTPILNAASVSGQGIVFTTDILHAMNQEQIAAITGHELSHHRHNMRDWLIRGVCLLAGAYAGGYAFRKLTSTTLNSTFTPVRMVGNVLGGLSATIIPDYLGAMAAVNPWQRHMEVEADREGALATSPEAMKSSLMRLDELVHRPGTHIQQPSLMTRIVQKIARPFPSHPSTEERIARIDALEQSR